MTWTSIIGLNKVEPEGKGTEKRAKKPKATKKKAEKPKETKKKAEKPKETVKKAEKPKKIVKTTPSTDEEQGGGERCKHFPCCFYIPLEIAMEGFALIDIIFYTLSAIVCAIILTFEPFSGRDPNVRSNQSMGLEFLRQLDSILRSSQNFEEDFKNHEENFDVLFSEASTTLGPIQYSPEEYDYDKMSRTYSRIAWRYKAFLQEVDDACGRTYLSDNLFTHQLKITNRLFEEVVGTIIEAYLMYALCGALLLISLCCFRGYIYSKLMITVLWLLQLLPSYYIIVATILSQSQRLCFLEYGLGKTFRGQTVIAEVLLCPLILYKPYELFIWGTYIRKFFQNKNGKLLDESLIGQEKHKDFKYLQGIQPAGTDLTKHHYVQFVGGKKLFRQQTADNKKLSKVAWTSAGGGSRSSSDD